MTATMESLSAILSQYNFTSEEIETILKCKYGTRLIQYHKGTKNLKQYIGTPCSCGCNVYHLEYNKLKDSIYGVCNACNIDRYIASSDYTSDLLQIGVWLERGSIECTH